MAFAVACLTLFTGLQLHRHEKGTPDQIKRSIVPITDIVYQPEYVITVR